MSATGNTFKRLLTPAVKLVLWTAAVYSITIFVSISTPVFMQVFVDSILTKRHPEWAEPMCLLLGLLTASMLMTVVVGIVFKRRLQVKFLIETAAQYFWDSIRMPMLAFGKYSPGDLLSRSNKGYSFAVTASIFLMPALAMGIQVAIMLVLMLLYSPVLSCICLVNVVGNMAVMRISSKKLQQICKEKNIAEAELTSLTVSGISNIDIIKSVGGEDEYFRKAMDSFGEIRSLSTRINHDMVRINFFPAFFKLMSNILSLVIGAHLIIRGEITMGILIAFQGFLGQFVAPLDSITSTTNKMISRRSAWDRFVEIEDEPKDVPSSIQYQEAENLDKLSGDIEIRNVTFGYDKSLPPLIKGLNLKIKKGQSIALVGGSGSGKSTTANLITGLYEPWEGEVLYDGKPRSEINRHAFFSSLAVVNQDITLFNGSISDNIKMWDENTEDFAMIMASRDACIHDDIAARPGSYNSPVKDNGANFSGGQRQRMEIASALAKEPTIIVMDEATSALDPKTEEKVMSAIKSLGITIIVVAHRLSTVRDCDEIVVMQEGKIAERGNHDTLMAIKDGIYHNMMQTD